MQLACCLAIPPWEMEQVVASAGRPAHPSAQGPEPAKGRVVGVKTRVRGPWSTERLQGEVIRDWGRGRLLLPAESGSVGEGLGLTTKIEDGVHLGHKY